MQPYREFAMIYAAAKLFGIIQKGVSVLKPVLIHIHWLDAVME